MDNGVFYAPLASTDINPNRPFVIAGEDSFPRGEMMRPLYIKNVYPELKTYGVIAQEDAVTFVGQSWEVGAAKAAGWEIAYDEHFSPETTDFAPVVTALLAAKPDAVALNITWPDFIPLVMEQLYQQGFEGPINANYIEWESVLQKVPPEWAAKVGGYDSYPDHGRPLVGQPLDAEPVRRGLAGALRRRGAGGRERADDRDRLALYADRPGLSARCPEGRQLRSRRGARSRSAPRRPS